MDEVFGSASYTLVFVTNAGVADRGTMNVLARSFADIFESDS